MEPSGDLVYYMKLDGTMNVSVRVSQSKARAAATWRRPTKVFFDQLESGHPYVLSLDGVSGSEGGIPLMDNGKVIGAIGVSGGSGAQDGVVARTGLDALK